MADRNMIKLYDGEIEESFLHDNVEEARGHAWVAVPVSDIVNHQHCVVCWRAMPLPSQAVAYRSSSRWLCPDCLANFLPSQPAMSAEPGSM